MSTKKNLHRLIICILVLLVALAGIGMYNLNRLKAVEKKPQQGYTKLRFWTVSESYAEYMRTCAAAYNAQIDGEKIDLDVQVYSRSFIVDQINKSLLNDEQIPDLADIRFMDMHQFVNSAEHSMFLYPLNSLLSETDMPKSEAMEPFTFNNNLLALPYGRGEMAMFFNLDVCAAMGISYDEIHTWDEFFALGRHFASQKDVDLFALDVNNWDFLMAYLLQMDAEWVNKADTIELFQSASFQQIYDRIANALIKGWISIPDELNIYNQRFYESFQKGEYLCVIAPLQYAYDLILNAPDLLGKVRIRPLPETVENGKTPLVAQYGTAILARSKNIRLAKRFLEFAKIGEERYQRMAETLYGCSLSENANVNDAPKTEAFLNYFGEDALQDFPEMDEYGYNAASGLPKAIVPLASDFLGVCDE